MPSYQTHRDETDDNWKRQQDFHIVPSSDRSDTYKGQGKKNSHEHCSTEEIGGALNLAKMKKKNTHSTISTWCCCCCCLPNLLINRNDVNENGMLYFSFSFSQGVAFFVPLQSKETDFHRRMKEKPKKTFRMNFFKGNLKKKSSQRRSIHRFVQ